MIIQFKVNLGSNDAKPLGLNYAECTKGSELTVTDAVGEALVKRGIATRVEALTAPAVPAAIKAVPPSPATFSTPPVVDDKSAKPLKNKES